MSAPAGEFWYFYDPAGNMVADWVPGGLGIDELMEPVAGRVLASYENDRNDVFLKHQNALGSWGLTTYPDGGVAQDELYYPWGQPWAAGSYVVELNFAGMGWHDTESSLDWTPARFYESRLGRWLSPDPAGLAAVDPSNPQSFNQYAYVLNNPTSNIDPLGLKCVTLDDGTVGDDGEPPPCGNSTVWTSETINVLGTPTESEMADYCFRQDLLQFYIDNGPGGGAGGAAITAANQAAKKAAAQAATTYCQDRGQFSFNIPFTNIPVTVSTSGTLGPVNYSTTNDITPVVPLIPWPEWLSAGVSFLDITINAPATPTPSLSVGIGKNNSVGTYLTPKGPQGLTLSIAPISAGPPVMLNLPPGNGCGLKAGLQSGG